MRAKAILGLVGILIAGIAFVAGMLIERHGSWPMRSSPSGPSLLSPAEGATLANHPNSRPKVVWEFGWTEVPGAEQYYLQVKRPDAEDWQRPFIEKWVKTGEDSADPKRPGYRHKCDGYFSDPDVLEGWKWRVRAILDDGSYSTWSEVRTFKLAAQVSGTIEFKGEAKFEAGAVARVTLQDLEDAPAKKIGEQVIKNLNKFPISFEIEYDPAVIEKKHTYAVQVRIEAKDRLEYINDTRVEVISRGKPSQGVKVPVIQVKK
jgi:uncharacterized lipoprotein YbaY